MTLPQVNGLTREMCLGVVLVLATAGRRELFQECV